MTTDYLCRHTIQNQGLPMLGWIPTGSDSRDTYANKAIWACGIFIPWGIILFFCIPGFYLGVENLRMMRYFDLDEANLVEYGVRLCQNGVLPTEPACGYPKLFNYLCGIFLYPYTFLWGPSAKVVAITFRLMNIIAMALTTVVINQIGVRFFKSSLVGALSAILFAVTPQFLWWGVNSRPHPLEIFFIALAIYYCLAAVETRQTRNVWVAAFWAGLAIGTKLGGVFLVPTLMLIYVYQELNREMDREDLKPDRLIGNASVLLFLLLGFATLVAVFYGLFYVTRSSTGISIVQEIGWRRGIFLRPIYLGLGAGVLSMAMGMLCLWFSRYAIGVYSKTHVISGTRINGLGYPFWVLFGYKVFMFLVKLSLFLAALFLLTNFDYVIFPLKNLKEIGVMLYITFNSTSLHRDSSYFAWFTFFHVKECMGLAGALLASHYLLRELLQVRSRQPTGEDSPGFAHRMVLLSYPLVLLVGLTVGVQHRPYHYLLPAIMVLFLLGVDGLRRAVEKINRNYRRQSFQLLCVILIILCIGERISTLVYMRESLVSRGSDPAVMQLAPWLSSTYSDTTKIMCDDVIMYIPDTFKRLSYWKAALPGWGRFPGEKIAFGTLTDDSPNVFIRSKISDLDTAWVAYDAEYLNSTYSVAKKIAYLKNYKMTREAFVVYEKKVGLTE